MTVLAMRRPKGSAVGGAFLAVLAHLAQPIGGVVGVVGVVVGALFSGQLAGGAVGVGGWGVALAVLRELVIGVVAPGAGLVGAALAVVDGVVAVALQWEARTFGLCWRAGGGVAWVRRSRAS